MKTKILLVLVIAGFLVSCKQEKKLDNPDQLQQVLMSYFDGIKNIDLDEMNAVTTSDFVLFEDGKVWNNDSIYNFLKTMPPFTATYKFDNFNINIDIENGNMFYFNHMDGTMNDTTKFSYDWIESATFKKIDGEWKMNFLHSTVRK
ncbi:nuclear transport factor 2 family protein [Maribellus mangrovi]|uniref:nuclear transport factor 2 family protein n=1 Tax=Maribellus mangrovi TaxID=3133146 RepID=UPI0030EBAF11